MMAGMKIQLVCMLLLAFSSWSLCSDSEEEMKALEADLLTSMHTSKISKAHVPSWKMTLLNVCSLVNNLNSPAEETGEVHEEQLITRRKLPNALDGFSLEAMLTIYQLHKICHSRAFQHWELIQEDILDTGNDKNEKEEVIKRKIPYILKRQLFENKPRRPYILKRDSYYY
ncbi:PREDICTED: neurotensin/neuromedin N isoform X2 [Mandrillus leucophaeus]|uniref:Neurotensin/neuromedin N n=1 Tax=Mandrillus leucophaeus TaxID=9568 RepID=A0A2K5Z1G6_MANLE|nr:PREDICTED: neurotensin/neuromedin N isoform X2 [Mandrillus leucophaeus]